MRIRSSWFAVAAAGLALVASLGAQASLAKHPIIGSWKLNAAKSTIGITLTITAAPDGSMTMSVQGEKQTFKIDGKDYPGVFGSTTAWTEKGPRQWDAAYKMGGKLDNIDHMALSADGKTLTVQTERIASKSTEQVVFTRASGGPGLAGVWKATSAAIDSTAEYLVSAGKLSVHIEPSGERWLGPLDGKDYPVVASPSLPPGVTWAGREAGPRTMTFVLKLKGTPLQFATLTVAPDGKTLEIVQINGATETAPDRNRLIFERR